MAGGLNPFSSLRRQMLAMVGAFGVLICLVLLMATVNVREHDARGEIESRLRFSADASARNIEKLLELGQTDFGAVLDTLVILPELRTAAYVGPNGVVEQATDRRWIGHRLGDVPKSVPQDVLVGQASQLTSTLVHDEQSTHLWIAISVRQPPQADGVRAANDGRLLLWADTGGALRDAVWVAATLALVTVVLPVGLMLCITALWLRYRIADRIDGLLRMARAQVDGDATLRPDPAVVEGRDELAALGRELVRLFGDAVHGRDLARRLLTEMHAAHAALDEEQRRLRAVLDQAPVGIRHEDRQGRVLVNDQLCRMLGLAAEPLQQRTTLDFLAPEDRERRAARHQALIRGELALDVDELRLVRPDGTAFWARLSVHTSRDPDGGVGSVVTVIEDIDTRRRDEQELRLLAACFDAAGDPILVARTDGEVVAVNRALTAQTGFVVQDFAGQRAASILSPAMTAAQRAQIGEGLRSRGLWRGETMQVRRDGGLQPVLLSLSVLRDERGEATHHIATSVDLTRIREAEERIRRLAYFDSLTGLSNRQSLRERAAALFAADERMPTALLFIDLDNFKEVNDSLGHAAGDRMLCEVAARLLEQCRETDLLARLGGDEFVLLLPGASAEAARAVGQRILAALQPPIHLAGHAIGVTASVGVSLAPHDGEDLDALMKNADTAMYQAKLAGRNALRFYDRSMNEATLERLTLLSALRRAASNGELRTYYQPKVDLLTGQVTGAEALLRWEHPTMGLVPPDRFIPAAEQSDLIVTLDEWVLADVCRQLQAWREQGLPPLTVSVNVAALHFRKATLVEDVLRTLACFDVPGSQIELEITEAALLEAGQERRAMMEQLRERGLSLAIDDFGTGYSSLAYLKHLPISTLKIDRSFVRDLEHDVDDRVLVSTIVTLAHNLGLQVVAEGVENEAQRRHLIHSCCEQAQGWLYAKAMPAAAFAAWRREQADHPLESAISWREDWVSP